MRKIFLYLLLFASINFAQLIKPSKSGGSITTQIDNASTNSFIYVDSVNYILANKYFWTGPNKISFPLVTSLHNSNIRLGNFSGATVATDTNSPQINNITMGYESGSHVGISGSRMESSYNVFIGYQAGMYGTNIATYDSSDYCIGIGYNAGLTRTPTGFVNGIGNNINIGYFNRFANGEYNALSIGNEIPDGYANGGLNSVDVGNYNGAAGDSTISIGTGIFNYYAPNSCPSNIMIGTNITWSTSNITHEIVIGNNPNLDGLNIDGQLIINDQNYYPNGFFIDGDMKNKALKIQADIKIDSVGRYLYYHSLSGSSNRTAGIDSLTSGIDTVRTTAYKTGSLVFITANASSTGHLYVNVVNSLSGSYFIVKSSSTLDAIKYSWFILGTY